MCSSRMLVIRFRSRGLTAAGTPESRRRGAQDQPGVVEMIATPSGTGYTE